ncbi:MAG: cell envelope integrity protein TolA [Woeseia sp.]|nr:cell envelope integrity protein TolA [Woeseia sp.]NNE61302.1 cell envelope integrity protein TolA [Woeseia sp.]NNL54394.1 cell envelope integrity protein TolA [Woeseia sp.]
MRDDLPIIPVSLAILLHVAIVATMIFAFEFTSSVRPAVPLAIKGQLVSAADIDVTPLPEPDAEPEPVAEELPPEVDEEAERREQEEQQRLADQVAERREQEEQQQLADQEAERRNLEEQKRLEEQRIEQERVQKIEQEKEQERIRREQEAEQKRREQAEAERKRREEAEKEKQRQEAERKRAEEVERQRAENERKRVEAEEAERKRRLASEIADETRRLEAMESGEMARYLFAIQQKIQRNWVQPPSAHAGIECVALVRQLPGGEVVGVQIDSCNGDGAVRRSIEAAIYKASPLPQPANSALFDRNLRITVKPEQ